MGYATPIRAPQQVEYRLAESCGCDQKADSQVEYRLADPSDLRWIGSGLVEVGLEAGAVVDPDAARALMDGCDPRSGEQLVTRKRVLDPRGKVVARVLVDAVREHAEAAEMTPAEYLGNDKLAARFARAERGIVRDGEGHVLPVADVERIAEAAGLDAEELYGEVVITSARQWSSTHVDVGLRGVDVTAEMSKSISVAFGLADEATAAAMEQDFLDSINEAVIEVLEPAAAYGMAGHHGDGERAQRVDSSGLMGWVTLHRSARPVDSSPGDPHLHAHINIAHMVRCEDGKWRAPGAGGEDFHRYARLVNEVAEARFRARLIEKYGAKFEVSAKGAWELVGISEDLRTDFSRRHRQIRKAVGEGATREQQKSAARRTAEAKEDTSASAPGRDWRARAAARFAPPIDPRIDPKDKKAVAKARALALEVGAAEVDRMLAAALPGPDGSVPPLSAGGGPRMPSPAEIAARIWDPEHGLTASKKVVGRTHVLAAVAASVPYLLSAAQLETLTVEVLGVEGHAVRLADSDRHHQAHRERYTHSSIVDAELAIIDRSTAGLDAGLAQLTVDAAALTISSVEVANSSNERSFLFSDQQRAVITRLLTDGHAVDAVVGVAGAGKTTIMQAARVGWEAAGLRVVGASTAAVAAANLTAEAGIDSQTIAAWTREISGGRGLAGIGVLVIDEAAMVDDRALAVLLEHAYTTGTKVVAVGDPMQLRAVGVGGGFARIHRIVDGLALTENRRQRDVVERAALQDWRDGGRTSALAAFAAHGRVHADDTSTEALTSMLARWNQARTPWAGDPHGQISDLLLLAARKTDVETLNAGARALLVAGGELEAGRTFATQGDGRIAFAAGDLVHIRRNDYRSRRNPTRADVLNGFRGVVLAVADDDREEAVHVEWRRATPGGGQQTQRAWMSARDVAEERLTHGYALTIGSAQGLTSDVTIAYGLHADSHSLYPAMSRARQESHLHLPLADLEDDVTRIRLGEVRNDEERLDRAVAAYGRLLDRDRDDVMVTDELAAARPVVEVEAELPAQASLAREEEQPTPVVPQQIRRHDEDQAVALDSAEDTAPEPTASTPSPRELMEQLLAAGYASKPSASDGDDEAALALRQIRAHDEAQAVAAAQPVQSEQRSPAVAVDAADEQTGADPAGAAQNQRARLEELFATGYASRPEPAPEPEPVAAAPWREREFGHILTGNLEQYAKNAEEAAKSAAAKAAAYEARAAGLAAVLGTEQSPASVTYDGRVKQLDIAGGLLLSAREAEGKADGIREQVKKMYETNREQLKLERKVRDRAALKRSAITFQRGGLLESADDLRKLVDQRTDAIAILNKDATNLDSTASQARTQAREIAARITGHSVSPRGLAQTLEQQREQLPALRARLELTDTQDHNYLSAEAAAARRAETKASDKATGLREEATTRSTLPVGQKASEAAQRGKAAQTARAKQAQAKAEASRRSPTYESAYHPPAPDLGRGSGLGR
ncbi:MobF family relaxase [Streptomyces antarcticus]|uniref:MobF family relaxase n=1 Tax=Streptomyces antarcticus TaxID=2996458 RepID=UPI00226FCE18|nr:MULTISPECIES: MobF family relaxase [unclassified Streptomyces]MCY0947297.1 AAA family ATPase [Streptomyces sp. H34-AA3]MCZ4086542.1 AAA family ATPase [Streptomyces sp. H34-S5]